MVRSVGKTAAPLFWPLLVWAVAVFACLPILGIGRIWYMVQFVLASGFWGLNTLSVCADSIPRVGGELVAIEWVYWFPLTGGKVIFPEVLLVVWWSVVLEKSTTRDHLGIAGGSLLRAI